MNLTPAQSGQLGCRCFCTCQAVEHDPRCHHQDEPTASGKKQLLDETRDEVKAKPPLTPQRHDTPISGESNVDHAQHCARCQDDARRGPLGLRT